MADGLRQRLAWGPSPPNNNDADLHAGLRAPAAAAQAPPAPAGTRAPVRVGVRLLSASPEPGGAWRLDLYVFLLWQPADGSPVTTLLRQLPLPVLPRSQRPLRQFSSRSQAGLPDLGVMLESAMIERELVPEQDGASALLTHCVSCVADFGGAVGGYPFDTKSLAVPLLLHPPGAWQLVVDASLRVPSEGFAGTVEVEAAARQAFDGEGTFLLSRAWLEAAPGARGEATLRVELLRNPELAQFIYTRLIWRPAAIALLASLSALLDNQALGDRLAVTLAALFPLSAVDGGASGEERPVITQVDHLKDCCFLFVSVCLLSNVFFYLVPKAGAAEGACTLLLVARWALLHYRVWRRLQEHLQRGRAMAEQAPRGRSALEWVLVLAGMREALE